MRGGAEHAGIGDLALRQAVNQRRRVLFSERAAEASRQQLIRADLYSYAHTAELTA